MTLTRSRRACSAPNEQPCCQRCHPYLSLLGDVLFRLLQPRPFLAGKRSDQDPQRQIVHTDGGLLLLDVASLRNDGLRTVVHRRPEQFLESDHISLNTTDSAAVQYLLPDVYITQIQLVLLRVIVCGSVITVQQSVRDLRKINAVCLLRLQFISPVIGECAL